MQIVIRNNSCIYLSVLCNTMSRFFIKHNFRYFYQIPNSTEKLHVYWQKSSLNRMWLRERKWLGEDKLIVKIAGCLRENRRIMFCEKIYELKLFWQLCFCHLSTCHLGIWPWHLSCFFCLLLRENLQECQLRCQRVLLTCLPPPNAVTWALLRPLNHSLTTLS